MAKRAKPAGVRLACCWPIGKPSTRSFRFCERLSAPDKAYCARHALRAYVPVPVERVSARRSA